MDVKNLPLVSVGIPTYNRPELLRRALNSLKKQTYKNLEIVVSDNATPGDDVQNVITEFQEQGLPIKFFKQIENIGPESNFVYVLQQASGEYFFWMADDDQLISGGDSDGSNYITDLLNPLLFSQSYVYSFGGYVLSSNGVKSKVKYTRLDALSLYKRMFSFFISNDDCSIYGMYRKKTLDLIKMPVWMKWIRKSATNKAYPMVFEGLMCGACAYVPECVILKDDDAAKDYNTLPRKGVFAGLLGLHLIFLNTYFEYFRRSVNYTKSPVFFSFLIFMSIYGVVRDSLPVSKQVIFYPLRKIKRLVFRTFS